MKNGTENQLSVVKLDDEILLIINDKRVSSLDNISFFGSATGFMLRNAQAIKVEELIIQKVSDAKRAEYASSSNTDYNPWIDAFTPSEEEEETSYDDEFFNAFKKIIDDAHSKFKNITSSETITVDDGYFTDEYKKITVDFPDAEYEGYFEDDFFGLSDNPYPSVIIGYHRKYHDRGNSQAIFSQLKEKLHTVVDQKIGGNWYIKKEGDNEIILESNNAFLPRVRLYYTNHVKDDFYEVSMVFRTNP